MHTLRSPERSGPMREFNLLSIATTHQHIAPVVEAQLSALGFALQKPLHWIRSADAPIRQMFRYGQLKGGALAPQWGFSLDFVPHLSGGKVKWHRTEKSALFDAFVDGQGSELSLSYMWGVAGLLEQKAARKAPFFSIPRRREPSRRAAADAQ